MQCITSLKNEDTSICFQKPQLLTGVRNWVTTLRKPKEGRKAVMEREADIFRIEMSKEEPAQDTLSWRLRADENLGLKAGNPHFPLHMKATLHMANPLFSWK